MGAGSSPSFPYGSENPHACARSSLPSGEKNSANPAVMEKGASGGNPQAEFRAPADTANRLAAETIRERKAQARVDQRSRLAGARSTDEDVPGQVVEILLRAEGADPGPQRRTIDAEAELLQQIQGLLEALAELGGLRRRRRGPGRIRRGRLQEARRQRRVSALGPVVSPGPFCDRRQHDERNLDPANRLLLVRTEVA